MKGKPSSQKAQPVPRIGPNNCPIREFTADGCSVGRCWFHLTNGVCERHGDVAEAQRKYIATGELTDEEH